MTALSIQQQLTLRDQQNRLDTDTKVTALRRACEAFIAGGTGSLASREGADLALVAYRLFEVDDLHDLASDLAWNFMSDREREEALR